MTPFVTPNSTYDAQAMNAQRDLAAAAVTLAGQSRLSLTRGAQVCVCVCVCVCLSRGWTE